jgi:cell division protein FtsB
VKNIPGFYGIFISVVVVVLSLSYAFIGERGIIRLLTLKNEIEEITKYNQNLKAENRRLREYSALLKNDEKFIEKIARDELGLVSPEEVVYCFNK